MLVLGAVAVDGLDFTVIAPNGNGETDNVVAGADHFKVVLGDARLGRSAVKEKLNLLEEAGLLGLVSDLAEGLGVGSHGCSG